MQDLFLSFHDVWGQPGWKFQAQKAHVMTTLHPLPSPSKKHVVWMAGLKLYKNETQLHKNPKAELL